MCWTCEHPDESFADYVDDVVVPVVEREGWALQWTPRLAYTVGLTAWGRPEVAVTGKPPDAAHDLVSAAVAGEELPVAGRRCDLVQGPALHVVQVARPRLLRVAWQVYGPRVRAVQLLWADSRGRWPWETRGQELLGAIGLPRAS